MPTIRLPLLRSALLCAGCLAAVPATAGELYRWVTTDGTVAYADDARRVPEAFRSRAVRAPVGSLGGYARFTPTDEAAQSRYQDRLAERLERLRAVNATGGAALADEALELSPASGPALGDFALRSPRRIEERRRIGTTPGGQPVYRRTSRTRTVDEPLPQIAFAVDPADPAPVVVERRRVLDEDTGVTRHVTVVEQGDRVLGVIKPRVHAGPPYRGLEEDLERR
jgi:hypothetical protein